MSLRIFGSTIRRAFHLSTPKLGADSREHRAGHKAKSDKLEGEYGSYEATDKSFELIDENLMDTVIDNQKFKDIPIVQIKCTRNNTKIKVFAPDNSWSKRRSAGTEGFKNCRKGTTVAAQAVANRIVTYAKDNNINTIRLLFDGLGPGRGAAYKVFEMSGLNVVSLSDRTSAVEPWVHRPRKAKRI